MRTAGLLGPGWDEVNAEHVDLLRRAIDTNDGVVVRTEGDAVFAVFGEAGSAVRAAVDGQRALQAHAWPDHAPVRVRMGLHAGEAHLAGDDYGGFEVNRAARVAATGHGGQIVASDPVAALVRDALPHGVRLRDLGEHRLRDVPRPERIWQLDVDGLPAAFPPLRTAGTVIGDLPVRLSSFIGRDAEVDAVVTLLRHARLVTLTGPGGIGKSSLAVEVARALAGEHTDGAWFVPLDSLAEPAGLEAAIARAIGMYDGPERAAADALAPYVSTRSMLLILDNFEHLLEAAPRVTSILGRSPASRILVTSRAPLRVTGEHEFPVPALIDSGPALFIARAEAVRPGWDVGAEARVVDEICVALDGLPLGIELAAARVAVLPLTAIRDRLIARLPLPGPGPRDVPARQRTLDAAVGWSVDLLSPQRQTILERLAVFEAGFDADQAAVVAGPDGADADAILEDLLHLADQHLVERDPSGVERIRFRMLQTIIAFGLARLINSGTIDSIRRRHADAFLVLTEQAMSHISTAAQGPWIERLSPDAVNLGNAIRWAIDAGEADLALRLVGASWRVWQALGSLVEGRDLTARALAMPGADTSSSSRMWAVAAAGSIAYWQGDSATAGRWYMEQETLARELDDETGLADAVFNLGHVAFLDRWGPEAMAQYANESKRHYEAIGDLRGIARTEWALGNVALLDGRLDEATDTFIEQREAFERIGDMQYHAMTTASLAWATFTGGDVPGACRWAIEGISESYAMHDVGTTTISLHIGVLVAVLVGRPTDAARLSGAFDALCERYGVRPPAALGRFINQTDPFAMARAALSDEVYHAMFAEGRRMTLDEAVALVVDLGDAIGMLGDAASTKPPSN
jgi:predicted ATPase